MIKYAIQVSGAPFVPINGWSTDPEAAIAAVHQTSDYDLLVWEPVTDQCRIYAQRDLADLGERVEHTAYAKLLARLMTIATDPQLTHQLKSTWYLVIDLALLERQSLLNTAAALVTVTVQAQLPGITSRELRGLADQARCWLVAAAVTPLQLVATPQPLKNLLTYLSEQPRKLAVCQSERATKAWRLANDALVLNQTPILPQRLQFTSAWTLFKIADFEQKNN
ncbi:hypothetical protein [Lactiplantibacillus plajomi]|uniref:Uncharacterized protein n=1 Tax=Lactiplantibacillus plajomi TaxID=1457217 RepID=A0ABV6K0E1_9LACO|nr:hypothetical protein [Lactiplantibacillus plajomi]